MAKRKAKKTTTRRRGRVSGINAGSMLQTAGGVLAGAVAANYLSNFIAAKVNNPKVVAAATLGAGLFLPKVIKGPMGQNAAHGVIAMGGIQLLKALNVPGIAGIGDAGDDMYTVGMLGDIDDDGMSGFNDGLAGIDDGLAGIDDGLAGYDDY